MPHCATPSLCDYAFYGTLHLHASHGNLGAGGNCVTFIHVQSPTPHQLT